MRYEPPRRVRACNKRADAGNRKADTFSYLLASARLRCTPLPRRYNAPSSNCANGVMGYDVLAIYHVLSFHTRLKISSSEIPEVTARQVGQSSYGSQLLTCALAVECVSACSTHPSPSECLSACSSTSQPMPRPQWIILVVVTDWALGFISIFIQQRLHYHLLLHRRHLLFLPATPQPAAVTVSLFRGTNTCCSFSHCFACSFSKSMP